MFDLTKLGEQFGKECLGCGLCLEACPIIPNTDLKGVDPGKIMIEILDLFQHKKSRGFSPNQDLYLPVL